MGTKTKHFTVTHFSKLLDVRNGVDLPDHSGSDLSTEEDA